MQTEREKHAKKAKRMSSIEALSRKRAKIGKEQFVETSHGKIRVLEYGFDSKAVAPLYVDMHGGGFALMSADSDEQMNVFFREQTGVKIVSIDYPKAPDYPYPIAVEAVYDVVLHYVSNADEYGINPQLVGVGGHSAGGNLATVTCIRAKERGDLTLRYQILDYPPLDLYTDPLSKPTPKKSMVIKMGVMFNACYIESEKAKDPCASPVFATTAQLVGLPPALIIVAGLDSLHDEGVRYANMLKSAGVDVELHDFPDSGHGFTLNNSPESKRAHKMMADFISRNIH